MDKETKRSTEFLRENQPWSDSECKVLIRCAIESNEWLGSISKRHLRSPHSLRDKLIEYGEIEDDEDCNFDFADSRHRPKRETDKELRDRWDRELPDSLMSNKSYSELETPSMDSDEWDDYFDNFDNYDWEHYLGGNDDD